MSSFQIKSIYLLQLFHVPPHTHYVPIFFLCLDENPFEVEKNEQELQDSDVVPLIEALRSEERIIEHVNNTLSMQDAVFPVVNANIKAVEKKQQEHPFCPSKVGET